MTSEEYRKTVNPCWSCPSYDEDMGCMVPDLDRSYACPLKQDEEEEYYGD